MKQIFTFIIATLLANQPQTAVAKTAPNHSSFNIHNSSLKMPPGGWRDLNGSLNGTCYAMVKDNEGNIIVGGAFTEAGGVPALNVAKWDGETWSALGNGLDGTVRALAVLPDGTICAGGDFSRKTKQWNGTNWAFLGGSLNSTCYALAVDEDGRLYAGGSFTNRLDTVSVPSDGTNAAHTLYIHRTLDGLARLDSLSGWEPLLATNGVPGAGVGLASFADGSTVVVPGFGRCFALATHGDKVYIGGSFTHFSGILASRVAVWQRNSANDAVGEISTLGSGLEYEHPFNTFYSFTNCQSLAVDPSDGSLFAGGRFNRAGGGEANFIAKWDGASWSGLGTGFFENSNSTALEECRTLLFHEENLYAGGKFTHAGDLPAKNFAKWDGEEWAGFCSGFVSADSASATSSAEGPNAMTTDGDGSIFVGGFFDFAGNTETQGIAKWDLSGQSSVWFADADDDNFGDPNDCATADDNETIFGRVANNGDCNDEDENIHPGASEICNGSDEDCDDEIDENTGGIPETCNGHDENCNGEVDEGFDEDEDFIADCFDCALDNPDYDLSVQKEYIKDADGDGFGCDYGGTKGLDADCPIVFACAPPDDTYVLFYGNPWDCDDTNPEINPEAEPIACNGIDENCAGDIPFWYSDYDGDGFGSFYEYLGPDDFYYYYGHTFQGCVPPSGDDPNIFPGANFPPHIYDPIPHWSKLNTDCDDQNADAFPGSEETCNAVDDNCNAEIDEGILSLDWFADADGDGFGDPAVSINQDCPGPLGYVLNQKDCDDSDPGINPAAPEICDAADNDCNGSTDEGLDQDSDGIPDCEDCAPTDPTRPIEYFPDEDGDGYGLLDVTGEFTFFGCLPPAGDFSDIGGDCDDNDPTINPGVSDDEPCDGLDLNCDLREDKEWFSDLDGDGHGYFAVDFITFSLSGFYFLGCEPPAEIDGTPIPAWSLLNDDCDDGQTNNFPGNSETCDGSDNDCDELVDAADTGLPLEIPGNGLDDDCDGQIDEGGFSLSFTVVEPSCFGSSNGSVFTTVTGGTPPFTYQWSNGKTSKNINLLPAGTYTLTATDAQNATSSATATVGQPSAVDFAITTNMVAANNWTVTLSPSGGTPGYLFSKGSNIFQASPVFENMPNGTFIFKVKDSKGCSKSRVKQLAPPVLPGFVSDNPPGVSGKGRALFFPNPANSVLHLDFRQHLGQSARAVLLNPLGLVVLEKRFDNIVQDVETLDLRRVPNGQYFLKIEFSENRVLVNKLIVSKLD